MEKAFAFQQIQRFQRKRRYDDEINDLEDQFYTSSTDVVNALPMIMEASLNVITLDAESRKIRGPNKSRTEQKQFWNDGYSKWNEEEFKERLRMNRHTFEYILQRIEPFIVKEVTNMVLEPIETHRQLALTIYRLAHGCSYKVVKDLFGISQSLATETFNKVIKVMISVLYDDFVKLPHSDEEWIQQCKGFLENYEFPCVGAWDGFHVHVACQLKNYYSFKNKYSITSMGLVGYDKRFLHLTTGAPGSTHDARLLRQTKLFHDIVSRHIIPSKGIDLGDQIGKIPLVTIGDSAFPRLEWLVKGFSGNTRDPVERYYNKKLCSARVVTENAYGMLKGRWRLIYKKCEAKLYNIKYVIMAAVMLHNMCLQFDDPCMPRWRLSIEQLGLVETDVNYNESNYSKGKSTEISRKIATWLWEQT